MLLTQPAARSQMCDARGRRGPPTRGRSHEGELVSPRVPGPHRAGTANGGGGAVAVRYSGGRGCGLGRASPAQTPSISGVRVGRGEKG